ncbi:MAG: TIGR02266 family protein [Myxococcales bacterium]|nr:TIGR02266 family protein [Myxococcales bacterium]
MTDNRKYDRLPSRLRCWCEGDNVTVYARIGNLSEGGLFVRTSTPLAEGARAVLRFGMGEAQEVEAHATVVWTRSSGAAGPPGMGLRFDDVDAPKLELIRKIIQSEQNGRKPGSP